MEAEVFLLGHWTNYDELESALSLDELLATLEAQRKSRHEEHHFMAAIQGISLPDQTGSEKTFEDIQRDAMIIANGGSPDTNDVASLQGNIADHVGFGVNVEEGLSYEGY